MNTIELIKTRKSCRSFRESLLTPSDKKTLEGFIEENQKFMGKTVTDLRIVERKTDDKKMTLNYGMIPNHNSYLLGTSELSTDARVGYGYSMEKVVLKATEIGISSCWIGYFDSNYFEEITPGNGFEIPAIVILGYANDRQTRLDKFTRFTVSASKRQNWETLFFDFNSRQAIKPEMVHEYADSLEMVRLAPSSGNTQPWRIYYDDTASEFHFFKKPINRRYEDKGLHSVDLGIAMSHFELTSEYKKLSGSWIKHANIPIPPAEDLYYMMTWKCK